MLQHEAVPCSWKAGATNSGELVGYASTYDRDLGGDIVVPGAFTKTIPRIKARGIPLLADHVASTRTCWARSMTPRRTPVGCGSGRGCRRLMMCSGFEPRWLKDT
jgi:hypothetical protein